MTSEAEVATAIYYAPAPPGSERENNLTWEEAKWYARTALRALDGGSNGKVS